MSTGRKDDKTGLNKLSLSLSHFANTLQVLTCTRIQTHAIHWLINTTSDWEERLRKDLREMGWKGADGMHLGQNKDQ